MQRDQRHGAHATRRRFLGSIGLATAGLGAAARASAAADAAFSSDGPDQFVVEQGDQCIPVVPLSGDVPIKERYGWAVDGADFSATGLVDLQRPDTSVLFLYDGPNGLSLVVVHDEYGDGTDGGSATFEFAGLPVDGEWVVRDDDYDGDSNYDQWTRDGDRATVDWTWGDGRTDGGAFRGLGTDADLELRISPFFNAEATLYGEYYDGEIDDWEVLSESPDGLTRTSLALDEPVIVRRGTCSSDGTNDDGGDEDADDEDGDDDGSDTDDDSSEEQEETDDDDSTDGDDEDSKDDDREEEDNDDHEEEEDDDGEDDDKDEEGDDDEHPGRGEGHENGRGEGHENEKGRGHERHGDEDGDEGDDDSSGEDRGKGRGEGKGRGKGKGRGN